MKDKHPSTDAERLSKSQLKREMRSLQQLGEQIYQLPLKQRRKIPLTADLIAAFEEADRIKSKEAQRRHFQYVGKLMRETNIEEIETALAQLAQAPLDKAHKIEQLSALCLRLVTGDGNEIENLVEEFASANRQKLRQLIRNCRKENKTAPDELLGTASGKKLLQYLKEIHQLN